MLAAATGNKFVTIKNNIAAIMSIARGALFLDGEDIISSG